MSIDNSHIVRPYGTPITLVLPKLEIEKSDSWKEYIDLLAYVNGKAYELGIRNIKFARIGVLLEETWLTSQKHCSLELERQLAFCQGKAYPLPGYAEHNMYICCTWYESSEMAREVEMEILDAPGGQNVHAHLSRYLTLHSALRSLLRQNPAQEEVPIQLGTMVRTIPQEAQNPAKQSTA